MTPSIQWRHWRDDVTVARQHVHSNILQLSFWARFFFAPIKLPILLAYIDADGLFWVSLKHNVLIFTSYIDSLYVCRTLRSVTGFKSGANILIPDIKCATRMPPSNQWRHWRGDVTVSTCSTPIATFHVDMTDYYAPIKPPILIMSIHTVPLFWVSL